jgi:ParB-like chromosome segregation protein Spo0J
MKLPVTPTKTGREKNTASRRVLQSIEVKREVERLRSDWASIGKVERGERLKSLMALGVSRRGLGEALGESANSIRRYLKIASLPEPEQVAIKRGVSAKKVLQNRDTTERRERQREKANREVIDGSVSDELAEIIVMFCCGDGKDDVPIYANEMQHFLDSVRFRYRGLVASTRPIAVRKRQLWDDLLKRTKPPVASDDATGLEYLAEWLATILLALSQDLSSFEHAYDKALKIYETGRSDLPCGGRTQSRPRR